MNVNTVLLSLGSNVQPREHLRAAIAGLRAAFGAIRVSPTYRTAAVGFDGPDFLNNAVALQTSLSLEALEAWLHALEARHGRERVPGRVASRTLDVDVVFYGGHIVEQQGRRRIPRPELEHAFVLKPLADVAPEFVDPVSGQTLAELWRAHPQHAQGFDEVSLG